MSKYFRTGLSPIVLLTIISTLVCLGESHATWAAIVICPNSSMLCSGTSDDDVIIGTISDQFIKGLEGNDLILSYENGPNYLLGESGNDILIGGQFNDGLYGGSGDDKYDGRAGDDSVVESTYYSGQLEGNDNISGNVGNDFISAGGGADKIFGGPGNDAIHDSPYFRDFERDVVDCGSGYDGLRTFYSGDGDTAVYCEVISNGDG